MFGRKHRQQAGLSAKAHAEVLGVEEIRPTIAGSTELTWKLKLRVSPEGADPFDADVEQSVPQLDSPHVGQIMPVLFDPHDHSKVAIDGSGSAQVHAVADLVASRLDAQQTSTLEQITGGSVQDLISEAMLDPEGFAARMREKQESAMAQAKAAVAQAAPAPEDPLDKLTKLADLRDRGLVTAEEFESQKKRILGEQSRP